MRSGTSRFNTIYKWDIINLPKIKIASNQTISDEGVVLINCSNFFPQRKMCVIAQSPNPAPVLLLQSCSTYKETSSGARSATLKRVKDFILLKGKYRRENNNYLMEFLISKHLLIRNMLLFKIFT